MEYNGDAVVLYPKANLCSVDGIPISEPTRLPQGNNYRVLSYPTLMWLGLKRGNY